MIREGKEKDAQAVEHLERALELLPGEYQAKMLLDTSFAPG